MVTVTSDFECGNGKHITQLGDRRFRLEADGDKQSGYCVYFCFDVVNTGPETEATIEFWEDSQFGGPTGFPAFFPSTFWVRPSSQTWFRALYETTPEMHGDHVVLRLPVEAEGSLRVALTYTAPYSETSGMLRQFAAERANRCETFSLGPSVQGRELVGLRAGTPGKPKVFCVAGQHPHEHGGVWGMVGIADFISSLIPEAVALREEFEVQVVPIVNPDGNVMGRNAFNAEGFDMYSAFGDSPDAAAPEAHESCLLWDWAVAAQPALWMNFHGYTGWKRNSEYPYEGWYEIADRGVFADEGRRTLYEALCDTLRLRTDAPSTTETPGLHSPSTLCYQLAARHGVPHAFYELNNSTSGRHRGMKRGVEVFREVMATLGHYVA
jgi:hypothetical protein